MKSTDLTGSGTWQKGYIYTTGKKLTFLTLRNGSKMRIHYHFKKKSCNHNQKKMYYIAIWSRFKLLNEISFKLL